MPPRKVSNPPNPWASTHVEYLEEPPEAELEIFEEEARSILAENDSPDLGFRYSLNPYRGCFHACAYCLDGDTPILFADGRSRPLREVRVGDELIGTVLRGRDRRYTRTRVLAHWSTVKPAYRVSLADGTELIASADHRFLTERGWEYVAADSCLTTDDRLLGPGSARMAAAALDDVEVESDPELRVAAVTALGVELPMFDLTTETGDFLASGVVSHNCYARPSHQWLGYGAGSDFERKIVVKTNAAEVLRATFEKRSWQGERIMFSGDTDCYQPLEASYGLTRACLEVCAAFANPVGVITKSAVIRRDVDLLARLAREARVHVTLSIPFARDDLARRIEPGASAPSRRFDTLRLLSEAGVPTGVAIAPLIPGLTDPDIPEILERAHAAGARTAFMLPLRLPAEVLPVFQERIREVLPEERVRRIESAVVELRGGSGRMNDPRFGERFRGKGARWEATRALYLLHARRLGFADDPDEQPDAPTTFRRPGAQLTLF